MPKTRKKRGNWGLRVTYPSTIPTNTLYFITKDWAGQPRHWVNLRTLIFTFFPEPTVSSSSAIFTQRSSLALTCIHQLGFNFFPRRLVRVYLRPESTRSNYQSGLPPLWVYRAHHVSVSSVAMMVHRRYHFSHETRISRRFLWVIMSSTIITATGIWWWGISGNTLKLSCVLKFSTSSRPMILLEYRGGAWSSTMKSYFDPPIDLRRWWISRFHATWVDFQLDFRWPTLPQFWKRLKIPSYLKSIHLKLSCLNS